MLEKSIKGPCPFKTSYNKPVHVILSNGKIINGWINVAESTIDKYRSKPTPWNIVSDNKVESDKHLHKIRSSKFTYPTWLEFEVSSIYVYNGHKNSKSLVLKRKLVETT